MQNALIDALDRMTASAELGARGAGAQTREHALALALKYQLIAP